MNKQAMLEEIYNSGFNDELEKIAISQGLVRRAIASRLKSVGARASTKGGAGFSFEAGRIARTAERPVMRESIGVRHLTKTFKRWGVKGPGAAAAAQQTRGNWRNVISKVQSATRKPNVGRKDLETVRSIGILQKKKLGGSMNIRRAA